MDDTADCIDLSNGWIVQVWRVHGEAEGVYYDRSSPGTPGEAIDAGRGSPFGSSLGRLVDDDADGFRRQ